MVPGIDAQNLESIFEEHILCSHLDPLVPQRNVFATAERRFDFGAVLAAVGGPTAQSGVKANLKFTNPFKVETIAFSEMQTSPLPTVLACLHRCSQASAHHAKSLL